MNDPYTRKLQVMLNSARYLLAICVNILVLVLILYGVSRVCICGYHFCYAVFGTVTVDQGKGQEKIFQVETNRSMYEVADKLQKQGLIVDKYSFYASDLEGDGEQYVLEQLKRSGTRFNILKVAHHGSKNSTSAEFLAQVQPQYAIISCGKNNRYGHPHRELLSRLNSISAHILSTTEQGAVTVYAGRDSVSILGYFDKNK